MPNLKENLIICKISKYMIFLLSRINTNIHYMKKPILIVALSLLFIVIAWYAFASPVLTPVQIQERKTAEMLKDQSRIDIDNLKTLSDCHEFAEKNSKYPEQYLKIRSECYEKWKKPDIIQDKISKLYWTANLTPVSEAPPSKIECTIGNGSHDARSFAKNYPGVAWWKNNNPSGITLGSKELEKSFDSNGVLWYVGTARPAKEWSNYYWFPDLENGMKAKILIIKRSYKNTSIASYLKVWGTDSIKTSLDTSRLISSLSDSELLELTKNQIKKESWTLSDYIFENVIKCKTLSN